MIIAAATSEQAPGCLGSKSPAAFRTIAEVAADLELPAHVLRFWESKFPQIKPLKRRGGRRYYRPEDVALLRRIRRLLYTEGYTIKGVQRLLREGGGKPSAEQEETAAPGAEAGRPAEHEPGGHEPGGHEAAPVASEDAEPGTGALRAVLADLEALRALLRARGF